MGRKESNQTKNKHMSGFYQYYRAGFNFLGLKTSADIDYSELYTVCLVLAVSVAMDNRSLRTCFTDFNELITMFADKINQILLCI